MKVRGKDADGTALVELSPEEYSAVYTLIVESEFDAE